MTRSAKFRRSGKAIVPPPIQAKSTASSAAVPAVNYVDFLLPYTVIFEEAHMISPRFKKLFVDRYGSEDEAKEQITAWARSGKRLPMGFARGLYLKPNIPTCLPPLKRGQELYGYSFEAQAAAAVLAGAPDVAFSFQAVCDLITEGLEYQASLLVAWWEDPSLYGQALADAYSNMNPASWPKSLQNPDPTFSSGWADWWESVITQQHRHFMRDAFSSLTLYSEMDACCRRLMSLGMPIEGEEAFKAVNLPGNIREEYRVLCRLIQDQRTLTHEALRQAHAQGFGASLIKPHPDQEVKRWGDFRYGYNKSMLDIGLENPYQIALMDFALSDDPKFPFLVPLQQSVLMYEYSMHNLAELDLKYSPHMSCVINDAIGASALQRECMRVFGADNSISFGGILHSPEETWPKSFHKRCYRLCDVLNYIPIAQQKADPNWFILDMAVPRPTFPTTGFGTHLKQVFNALEAKFGRLDMYIVPSQELARQPYWHPETTEKVKIAPKEPPTLIPISDTPVVQSGHAYRKEQGIDISPDDIVDTFAAIDIAPVPEEPVIKPTRTTFKVNSALYDVAKDLLGSSKKAKSGQMRWDRIVTLLRSIGFKVETTGGSMYRFTPPRNAGRAFVEHSPHPEPTFSKIQYRSLGKRLQRLYGWELDWFVRSAEE